MTIINNDNGITFDGVKYKRVVSLYRPIDDLKIDLHSLIISEVQMTNTINVPYLYVTMLIEETGKRNIEKYICDGNSYLVHTIELHNDNIVTHIDRFIIDDISLVNGGTDSNTYKITAYEFRFPLLTTPTHYSCYGSPQEPSKIMADMFNANGITNINLSPIATEKKVEFISPVNATLWDSLRYLQNMSLTDSDFITFHYDHGSDAYVIKSIKDVYANGIIPEYNYLSIPSKESQGSAENCMFNITPSADFSGVKKINSALSCNNITYSHLSRNHTSTYYNSSTTNNVLPIPINIGAIKEEHIIKPIPTELSMYMNNGYEILDPNTQYLGNRTMDIIIFSDVISFTTQGYLERDVGQLISILSSPNSEDRARYSGTWLIARVENIFTGDTFKQNIVVSRTKKMRNENG